MSVKELSNEKNIMTIEVSVSAEDFSKALNKSYTKNRKYFTVQGFRKGKAPRKLIESHYGKGVFVEDAIEFAFPEAYRSALDELSIEPVTRPEMVDVKQADEAGAVFVVRFGLKPEVKLGDYKGAEIESLEVEITDEDIDNRLGMMQNQNARIVTAEDAEAQLKDTVNIDYKGFVDDEAFIGGEDHSFDLELGSGHFIPGFEDQLVGAKKGDEVDVKVTFPEEYHAENLAGKDAVFKVKVNEVKHKELPELDDEFAKDVSEFDTLDELKKDIADKLKEEKEHQRRMEAESAVIEHAVKNAEMDLPSMLVDDEVDRTVNDYAQRITQQGMKFEDFLKYTGSDLESFKSEMRKDVERNIESEYVLDAVVNAENIEVSDEELEEEYKMYADAYNQSIEDFKKTLNDNVKDYISQGIKRRKAVQALIDAANVK